LKEGETTPPFPHPLGNLQIYQAPTTSKRFPISFIEKSLPVLPAFSYRIVQRQSNYYPRLFNQ
jgi:hypothetical protein